MKATFDMKDKVKKLLNRANDPRTPEHERELAMDMATAIMQKYNIEHVADTAPTHQRLCLHKSRKWEAYISDIAAAACALSSCQYYFNRSGRYWSAGRRDNTEASVIMFEFLFKQVEELYKQGLPRGMSKADRANFRRTFKYACASRVHTRAVQLMHKLTTDDAAAANATGSTALVVRTTNEQLLDEAAKFLEDEGMTIVISTQRSRSAGYGTSAGLDAGNRVRLRREMN